MITKEEREARQMENKDFTDGLCQDLIKSQKAIRALIHDLKRAGRKSCVKMYEWERLQNDAEKVADDLSGIARILEDDVEPYDDEEDEDCD